MLFIPPHLCLKSRVETCTALSVTGRPICYAEPEARIPCGYLIQEAKHWRSESEKGKGEDREVSKQCDTGVLPQTRPLGEQPMTWLLRRRVPAARGTCADRMSSQASWSRFAPREATLCPSGHYLAFQEPLRVQGPMPKASLVSKFWSGGPPEMRAPAREAVGLRPQPRVHAVPVLEKETRLLGTVGGPAPPEIR